MAAVIESLKQETDKTGALNVSDQDSLRQTLASLRMVLGKERTHLNAGRIDLLEQFAREKLQILANLDRIKRSNYYSDNLPDFQEDVAQVNDILKENCEILVFQMDAIGEIAATIKNAVVDAESDGTYEASNSRSGFRPW